eukprot:8613452-Heterocapsa_arctica.AAC.1
MHQDRELSKISACKWREHGIGCTKHDIQDRERRDMPYRHKGTNHGSEYKQSNHIDQTKEGNNNNIGYIMFEDLGNKDDK